MIVFGIKQGIYYHLRLLALLTLSYAAIVSPANRFYELKAEWKPGAEYSLELDSMAFVDLYGSVSGKEKQGFRIKALDEYSTILFTLSGVDNENVVLQLLNNSDKVVKQIETRQVYCRDVLC